MDMQKRLQELADAIEARNASQARALLARFFDEGTFVELDGLARDGDHPAEAAAGYGLVNGAPAYAFAQDRNVCSGAVSRAQAAKIRRIYDLAAQNGAPVVGVFDSDGARLGDGIDAMDAIADILLASNNLSGVVPQIAVVAGACVGSASLIAANMDIVVGVKDADYYLNVGDKNAPAALLAENVEDALEQVRRLLSLLPQNNLDTAPVFEGDLPAAVEKADIGSAARLAADADSLLFLYGEEEECKTALGRIGGMACGFVTLAGDPVACAQASRVARFVRMCDAFSLPVVTFVDAAGFQSLKGAAKVSHAYAEATTAKVTVIVGKAYGPVSIAAAGKSAGADVVLAWPEAVISPVAPATAVHVLWKDRLAEMKNPAEDRERLAEEYAQSMCSPLEAAAAGVLTDVVTAADTRAKLIAVLEMLAGKRVSRLPKKHSDIQL